MVHVAFTSCIWLAVLIQSATAFYIPGVAPLDFRKGEEVEVKVRSFPCLWSSYTAVFARTGCQDDEHEDTITLRLL